LETKIQEFMGNQIEVQKIILELQDDGNTLRIEILYSILQIGGVTDGVELFVPLSTNN